MSKYTDEQRAEALRLYVAVGASEAARQTDIPVRTVRYWANQADLAAVRDKRLEDAAELLATKHRAMREELRLRLLEKTLDALDRMDQIHYDYKGKDVVKVEYEVAPADAFRNYAIAAGVLIDKYRLEMGESTGRMQVEHSETSVDTEIRKLAAELERRAVNP